MLTTRQRLGRDLGAVAMVVGRFIAEHNLMVVRSPGLSNHYKVSMKVGNGGTVEQYELDWRESRKLYQQRLSLGEFISNLGVE